MANPGNKCSGLSLTATPLGIAFENFTNNYVEPLNNLDDYKQLLSRFVQQNFPTDPSTIKAIADTLPNTLAWQDQYYRKATDINDFVKEATKNPDVLFNVLKLLTSEITIDLGETESKTDNIEDPSIVIEKSLDVNFTTKAYGTAVGPRSVMESTMREGLRNSIFYEDITDTFVQNTAEVNRNIKKFQEQLFETLKEYVASCSKLPVERISLYKPIAGGELVYTPQTFENFIKKYSKYLNPIFPELQIGKYSLDQMNTARLNDLYQDYNNESSNSKLTLDAYNAYFLLLHFDDMVHKIFPSMNIRKSKWNKFETDNIDKYSLGSGAHVVKGWQDQEKEIMPEELMDDVTKELIQNIDIYQYRSNISNNRKVAVSDFNRILTKIKQLANTAKAHDVMPEDSDLHRIVESIYGTNEFNGEITLYKILGNLNDDAAINYANLFKLLSTDAFWKFYATSKNNTVYLSNLNLESADRDIIWSLYLGVFKSNKQDRNLKYIDAEGDERFIIPESDESIVSLQERWERAPFTHGAKNYYNYLVQACVSMESFKLQQYKEKDGVILNQNLSDQMINDEAESIMRNINSSLSPTIYTKQAFLSKFNNYQVPGFKEDNFFYDESTGLFKFKIGSEHLIDVNSLTGEVTIKKFVGKGNYVEITETIADESLPTFTQFLKDIFSPLQIDGYQNGVLKEYCEIAKEAINTSAFKLTKVAARIFAAACAQQKIRASIDNEVENRQEAFIEKAKLYIPLNKNNSIDIDKAVEGGAFRTLINVQKDFPIIKDLAEAFKTIQGTYSDNTVVDSEGKQLSQIGMSMLATKTEQQFTTQNLKPNSASQHFILFKGGYHGMEFAREYSGEESVTATKFNTKEQFIAQFLYDYLGKIANDKTDVDIFPSPLSDKPRIIKIITSLLTKTPIEDGKGGFKVLKDLNPEELKRAIAIELGTYYYNIWKNTDRIFQKLNLFLKASGQEALFNMTENLATLNRVIKEEYEKSNKSQKLADFAMDFLHDIILKYNKAYPNDTVELTDQIMLFWDKVSGQYSVNSLLVSEIFRYSSESEDGSYLEIIRKDPWDFEFFREFCRTHEVYKKPLNYNEAEINNIDQLFDEVNSQIEQIEALIVETQNNKEDSEKGEILRNYNSELRELQLFKQMFFEDEQFKPTGAYKLKLKEILSGQWLSDIKNKETSGKNPQMRYTSGEEFWKQKESDLVYHILENGIKIKTYDQDYETLNSGIIHRLEKGSLHPTVDAKNEWKSYGAADLIAFARLGFKNPEDPNTLRYRMICQASDCRGLSYEKNGKTYKYGDMDFNFYDFIADPNNKYMTFELNPCLETWNLTDFLISQEYMCATVGTYLNHPSKSKELEPDIIEEAKRWLAQVKRNVSVSATKYSFALNFLNGIRDTYKIAVIQDDTAATFTIQGQYDKGGAKPYDGATFVCGTSHYLENNSLAGSAVGLNTKPFVHSYKAGTGSGIIIKTAGFAITNANIRNCEFFKRMNKKMMQGKWKTAAGEDFHPDLSKDYFGDSMTWEPNGTFYYDENTNKYYQVKSIELTDASIGLYTIHRDEVNIHGDSIKIEDNLENVSINSNYDLWMAFGGENSMSLTPQEDGSNSILRDSETSFINVVHAMNSISEDAPKSKENPPRSQREIRQTLKYSNIDYVVTEGAIKQGAANINSKRAYYEDDYELTTMEVPMFDSGIQLDAEHHADESTLSIMTQVVNALCARGYTLDEASDAYQAMYALTMDGLSEYKDALAELFNFKNSDKLLDAVAHTLVKGLKRLTGREGNLAAAVSEQLMQDLAEGKPIDGKRFTKVTPMSHPAMYKQLVSILSSALNKQSIKIKFPGSLAVLNPSNRIWKLYGDRLLGDYRRDKTKLPTKEALKKAQKESDSRPLEHPSGVKLGHSYYLIHEGEPLENRKIYQLESPYDYWKFRKEYAKLIAADSSLKLVEDVMKGRDLATYQCHFKTTDGESYNMWDLDIVKRFFYIDKFSETTDLDKIYDIAVELGIEDRLSYLKSNLDNLRNLEAQESPQRNEDAIKLAKSNIEGLRERVTTDILNWFTLENSLQDPKTKEEQTKGLYNRDKFNIFSIDKDERNQAWKLLHKLLQRDLQLNLHGIGKGVQESIRINGELKTITGEPTIVPYELIMPKVFATRFGLKQGDSLSAIMSNGEGFFTQQITKNWQTKVRNDSLFDLEFKNLTDGKQYYVVSKNSPLYKQICLEYKSVVRPNFKWDGNKLWRMDHGGDERRYRMHSEADEIRRDSYGNEIIVTDNPIFYVESLRYDAVRVSNTLIENHQTFAQDYLEKMTEVGKPETIEYLEYLGISDKDSVKDYWDAVVKDMSKILQDYSYKNSEQIQQELKEASNNEPMVLTRIRKNAQEKFTSFKESLNILAARIPAQSMQSFMPMIVVGFDDAGVNNAYVNYWQIYLQGSDFDIDKVSLLGHSFTIDGKFYGWSPLFNLQSEETLHASMQLPFPSGKKVDDNLIRVPSTDPRLKVWNLIMGIVSKGESKELLLNKKGYFKRSNLSPAALTIIAEALRDLNENTPEGSETIQAYIPDSQFGGTEPNIQIFKQFLKLVDKHNTYLSKVDDKQPIITNFITTYMLKVSRNPVNLIQAHSSVDYLTEMVKNIAKEALSAKKTDKYAPGNAMSKIETLLLTLTGKENTGIVASAMKVYEALSYQFNHDVKRIIDLYKNGNIKEAHELISKILFPKGLTVCGVSPSLLSNTFTPDTFKFERIENDDSGIVKGFIEALKEVNNDEDAFLIISALLSLATDNAKDPTLAKINAGPDMIGMYTAGIALGVPFSRLTATMMSRTGDVVNTLLNGNVFFHEKTKKLNNVETYIDRGPELTTEEEALKCLDKAIQIYERLSNPNQENLNQKSQTQSEDYTPDPDTVKNNLIKIVLKYGNKGLYDVFNAALQGTRGDNDTQAVRIITRFIEELLTPKEKIEENVDDSKLEEDAATSLQQISEQTEALVDEAISREQGKQESENTSANIAKMQADRRIRRILYATLNEWLDWSYAYRVSRTNYLNNSGKSVHIVNKHLKPRTSPTQCYAEGQGYVWESKSGIIHVNTLLKYEVPDTDEYKKAVEEYFENLKKWKEEYQKIKAEIIELYPGDNNPTQQKERKKALKRLWQYFNTYKNTQKDPKLSDKYLSQELRARILTWIKSYPSYPLGNQTFKYDPNSDPETWEVAYNPWESMKTLSSINTEMGHLRDMLKLNQGLNTSPADIIVQQVKLESLLLNKFQETSKEQFEFRGETIKRQDFYKRILSCNSEFSTSAEPGTLDLYLFLTNSKYRELVTDLYESMKTAFNILKTVYETAHYRGYLSAFNTQTVALEQTFQAYRSSRNLGKKVISHIGTVKQDRKEYIYEAMYKFTTYTLNNLFLRSLKDFKIVLDPGITYFNENLEETTSTEPVPIMLGTDYGNATFKAWFEGVVIPNLKSSNGLRIVPRLIKDLIPVQLTRTVTGNATSAFTLPISSMPRSESEKRLYAYYKEQFNQLKTQAYYSNGTRYSLHTLFFIYNLITYGEENNRNSFTPFFEDLTREKSLKIQEQYNEFYGNFDATQDLVEGADYTIDELLMWCAPKVSKPDIESGEPYIIIYNPKTMRNELWHYVEGTYYSDEAQQEIPFKGYQPVEGSNLNSKLLPYTLAKVDHGLQIIRSTKGSGTLSENNIITQLFYKGKSYNTDDLLKMLKERGYPEEDCKKELQLPVKNGNLIDPASHIDGLIITCFEQKCN